MAQTLVTSLVEVRIEIVYSLDKDWKAQVTSLVEVRIEIKNRSISYAEASVTSLVEVRIEILNDRMNNAVGFCHFPCGSAD